VDYSFFALHLCQEKWFLGIVPFVISRFKFSHKTTNEDNKFLNT
jgi:hypothetical protein